MLAAEEWKNEKKRYDDAGAFGASVPGNHGRDRVGGRGLDAGGEFLGILRFGWKKGHEHVA